MRFNQNIGWIEFRLDMRADGAKRVKTLGSRELHIALLEVARRNIIQAGIPQNMGKRIVSVPQMRTAHPNDNRKLAFVFPPLGFRWEKKQVFPAPDRPPGVS